jgi:hypothetical protein
MGADYSFYVKSIATCAPTFVSPMGMRGDTFISLSFFNQILSAEVLSNISKLFEIGLILHPANLIEPYMKMSILLAFIAHAN